MAKSVLNRNKKAKKRFGNYVNRAFQLKKKQKGLSSHPDKKRIKVLINNILTFVA